MSRPDADPVDPKAFKAFAEFYPFYLGEHRNRVCRRLRFLGSSLALLCLAMLLATGRPQYLLYGLLCGYGCAWVGHFGFEKNRPASFRRPLYGLMGDWVMYRDIWAGRIPFQAPGRLRLAPGTRTPFQRRRPGAGRAAGRKLSTPNPHVRGA